LSTKLPTANFDIGSKVSSPFDHLILPGATPFYTRCYWERLAPSQPFRVVGSFPPTSQETYRGDGQADPQAQLPGSEGARPSEFIVALGRRE
jgi:hypothetical protein